MYFIDAPAMGEHSPLTSGRNGCARIPVRKWYTNMGSSGSISTEYA